VDSFKDPSEHLSEHPSEETLKRFVTGVASSEESRAVVTHLLKGCAPCATKIRRLMEPESVAGGSYEKALDRFDQELVATLESALDPSPAPPDPHPRPLSRHGRGEEDKD